MKFAHKETEINAKLTRFSSFYHTTKNAKKKELRVNKSANISRSA